MDRKTVLYISASLDGYISDMSGKVGWLGGHDPAYSGDYGYQGFFQSVGAVVMGWNTYHQVVTELSPGVWPYGEKDTYVLTHRQIQGDGNIFFVNESAPKLVQKLKTHGSGEIWICGGADIVAQLLPEGIIDEIHLSIMPCLLGGGIKLFPAGQLKRLALISAETENGVLKCIYRM